MTDTTQGELWPQLDISIRPWANPDSGDAGDALKRTGTADWTSDPRKLQAYQFFRSRGWSPAQAAGIVGGLRGETEGLNSAQIHDNGIGLGIAGWNGQRLQGLKDFAAAAGTAPTDLQTQLAFLDHELRTSEKSAGTALAEAQDPAAAGRAMLRYFRPSGWDSPGAHPERARYASQFAQGLGLGTSDSGAAGPVAASSAAGPSPDNLLAQLPQAKQASAVDQLLGLNGTERYQLWPERLARDALSAPHQALTQGFVPGSDEEIAAANAISNFAGSGAFPFAQRGAVGALGGRLTAVRGPAETASGATAPVFHSTAGQVLENAGFSRAAPSQWLAYLRNAQGVKGEELEWTGLADRLSNATEPQLTKTDLLQHLAENQVDLSEIPKQQVDIPVTQNASGRYEVRTPDGRVREYYMPSDAFQAGRSLALDFGSPKYGSYVLPGAEPGSYREALLQLPDRGGPYGERAVRAYQDLHEALHEKYGNGFRNKATPEELKELDQLDRNSITPNPAYRSSHWNEPNVLGHVRMNDRQVTVPGAEKPLSALFLEELQSDWHQQGRREGYKSDQAKLENKIVELRQELEKSIKEKQPSLSDESATNMAFNLIYAVREGHNDPFFTKQEHDLAEKYIEADRTAGRSEDRAVPDAPFRSTWPELLLKRMIREAAESGKDALAWTSGETQAARYDLSKQVNSITVNKGTSGNYDIFGVPRGSNEHITFGTDIPEAKLQDYIGKDLATKAVDDLRNSSIREYSGLDLRVGGEGMLKFYDDMLPKVAQKIVKKYGGKMELGKTFSDRPVHEIALQGEDPDYVEHLVHVLRLTPELRKAALSQGFPLFQAGVPLSVAAPNGRVHTLTPVAHDPFADQNILKGNAT